MYETRTKYIQDTYRIHTGYIHERIQNDYDTIYPLPKTTRPSRKKYNKTPAQAFTTPANEKKMGTIWIFVYYAVYGSGRGRCRDFLVLKWGGGLNLQIWDLNRAHETERTVFPVLQVFSMCRCKL